MSSRIPQSRTDLERQLQEQISFLESSCKLFDEGAEAEAKRLAVTVRVLVHDTKNSTSLLQQLDMKNKPFFNTASDYNPRNLVTQAGLCEISMCKPVIIFPPLDRHKCDRWSDFNEWWNQIIIVDDQKNTFSRRTLILYTANEDGGAHIDPELSEEYSRLTRENSLNWVVHSSDELPRKLGGHESTSIRQIAHELLRTLKPEMPLIEPKVPTTAATFRDFEVIADVGDDPCPCHSGKSFNECCGLKTTVPDIAFELKLTGRLLDAVHRKNEDGGKAEREILEEIQNLPSDALGKLKQFAVSRAKYWNDQGPQQRGMAAFFEMVEREAGRNPSSESDE